jgi:hypothetical protein
MLSTPADGQSIDLTRFGWQRVLDGMTPDRAS